MLVDNTIYKLKYKDKNIRAKLKLKLNIKTKKNWRDLMGEPIEVKV